ncbi:MAG: prepilin-type N-terminal cleavage/methylation domain-containing protein [Planctomycetota bacterium]
MLSRNRTGHSGFTLVEILIVVVILGILAAFVTPQFATAADDSRAGAFVTSLRTFAQAAEIHHSRTGEFPADSSSGAFPPELAEWIRPSDWGSGETPLGGVWDFERNSYSIISAVGVHFDGTGATRDDAFMADVDATFDDGDVTTGRFRRIDANRYYLVIYD